MIRTVTDPAFAAYGSALGGKATLPPPAETIVLRAGSTLALYRFDHPTFWDYRSDMTLLLIQDGERLERFYFDRGVSIRPQVTFGFLPLDQASEITGDPALLGEEHIVQRRETPERTSLFQPVRMLTFFPQQAEDGFYFRGEQHPPFELVYLKKGALHSYCGGQDLVLRPHQLLLVAPGQWHMQYAEEAVQFLTVSFLWEGHSLEALTNTVLSVPQEIRRFIGEMEREYSRLQEDSYEYMNALLKLTLLRLQRLSGPSAEPERQSPPAEQMRRDIIDKALQAVSAHVCEKYTVSRLAAAVNVSPTYLHSLFQQYIGMPPAKYITRIRLEECKALLAEGSLSVGEIAQRMGYSSVQHFSKQFHQWVGCGPSAYARQFAEGPQRPL